MPDYYLISNVYDELEDERTNTQTHCMRNQPKPKPINLLLPSVHASRDHNILIADIENVGDPQEAVSALLASCEDSGSWPSSGYRQDDAEERPVLNARCPNNGLYTRHNEYDCVKTEAENIHALSQHNLPNTTSPSQLRRGPLWNYDTTDPNVLDAARSLFFERKRQMALYGMYTPMWPQQHRPYPNLGMPRVPTEYELFTAWACLTRTEKQRYIHEVTNVSPGGTSLEARRAVTVLFSCCPDSLSWPSLQFLRAQESLAHRPFPYVMKN